MFKRTKVSTAVLLAAGGALLGAQPTWAQERVEVTGSRIKSVGNESSSPITSVGKLDIDTVQPVAVEELVRGLPAAYPAIGPNINNGSAGIATIDLRGLGPNRTLVLVNGKRFVPSDLRARVDTNNVPVSLIERVDLVTGGASAVYGADAVAGVVNFVTKRNFTGVEATTLYSVSDKGDAKRYKNDLTIGSNLADGRGNVVVNIGTTRTDPLRVGERDYSGTVLSSASGNPGGFSNTAVPAQFSGIPGALAGQRVIDASTGLLRATVPTAGNGPPDGYNTNPPNYFETPLKRTQATALGRFTINEYAEAYTEVFHTRSNVTLNLAPSGTFAAALNIPIGNPYITDPVRQQLCGAYGISAANCTATSSTPFRVNVARRFVEAGPRIYSYDNTTTQYTAGLRGSIPYLESWSYDAYYQSGRSDQTQTTGNGFSSSKLQLAVNALNPTSCVSGGNCVPINLFGAAGSITPAMLSYLSTPTFQTTLVQQKVMAASANGEVPIITSPFAKSPLGLALGAEQRKVFAGNKSDAVVQTQGELLGSGAPTPDRSGELKFKEAYLEAKLPLVQNMTGIQSLNIEGGYRDTNFKTSAGADQSYGSWKGGLDWAPIKGLRLRGEKQRATRAPNINELYEPVSTGLASLSSDYCQGTKIGPVLPSDTAAEAAAKPALTALCQQTGVPAAQVGSVAAPSSNQINNTSGGNPNLAPEKADTTTFGIVWDPEFVDNLSLSIDYWKIKINGAVSSPTATQVNDGCYSTTLNPGLGYNVFCQSIQRDPLNGGLNGTGSKGVITQSSNLGTYDFAGVDIGAAYRLALSKVGFEGYGRLDMGLQLSYMQKADFKALPSVPVLEQAGRYGVDVSTPYTKVRFSQRTTWTLGDYSLGYNWRYIGSSQVQKGKETSYLPQYSSIPHINYVDLNGTWQAMKNLKLSLTVNNAFDKQPPLVGTGIGPGSVNFGNTFPSAYDVIGRRYTMSATATF